MGSVRKVGKNRYRLTVELGYHVNGQRIRKYKTVDAARKRDAVKLLEVFEREVIAAQVKNGEDVTFGEFVERWRHDYARTNLEPSTMEVYEYVLPPILSAFHRMKIGAIDTFHLVEFLNNEKRRGGGSLEKKYNLMQSIFKHAVLWKVIGENPLDDVQKPKRSTDEMNFYTVDEIRELLSAIKALDKRHQLIIKLALVGGLRRGEVLGIAYDCVFFERRQILIKRSLQYSKVGGLRLKETKTGEMRVVTFPESIMRELSEYYVAQLKAQSLMGSRWKGFSDTAGRDVVLFCSDEYGYPYHPNAVTRFWGRFMKRTDIKRIRFQDLRHSSASYLLSEGTNMKVLQKRLGHRNIKTTLDIYSHVTDRDDEKASRAFDRVLNSRPISDQTD